MAGRQDGRVKFILNENSKSSKCDLVIFSSKRFNCSSRYGGDKPLHLANEGSTVE